MAHDFQEIHLVIILVPNSILFFSLGRFQMKCNQCQMLSINGIACHETGCPNFRKVWRDGEWITLLRCYECGDLIEPGEICCEWPELMEYADMAEEAE